MSGPFSTSLYKVLQVDPEAETEVIRAAYVALAKKYHPDNGLGTARMMARLNEAWDILGDPAKRTAYDRSMAAWAPRPVTRPASVWSAAGVPEASAGAPGRTAHGASASSRLDFGRYAGWTLDAIGRQDPDYLEWLARAPAGRRYRTEIYALLAGRDTAPKGPLARAGARADQRRGRGLSWATPWRTRPAGG